MQDRRQSNRTIGTSNVSSEAEHYHRTQSAALATALMLSVCGVSILRPDTARDVDVNRQTEGNHE